MFRHAFGPLCPARVGAMPTDDARVSLSLPALPAPAEQPSWPHTFR